MQDGQGSGNSSPDRDGDWPPAGEDSPPGAPELPGSGGEDAGPEGLTQPRSPGLQSPAAEEVTRPADGGHDAPGATWAPSPSGEGHPRAGQPGETPPPAAGQPGHGQPGETPPPAAGQPGHSQPGYGQPGYGQPSPPPPPIWHGQPGGQEKWVPPLPGDQAAWPLPPAGQGTWGTPPGGGYGQPPVPQPPRRPARVGRVMLFIVVAALAAALGAGVVLALQGSPRNSASSPGQNPSAPTGGNGTGGTNTATINEHYVAGKVQPGLVDITSDLRYTGQVFEGTGMVLTSSGLVLTNNHVVNQSTRLEVTLVSTGRRYPAQIVGTDSANDVALLRLVGASGLRTVQVGNSSKITLGTPVVALGNAGGAGGSPTVTSGTITALNRTITASDSGSNSSETLHGMLQTNAPIAEGDSGGALANSAGQVIGMNTAANTRTLGGAGTDQGFAIPINRVLSIAHQMEAGHGSGSIRIGQPAFIGIAIASKSSTAASTAADPRQQLQQLERVAGGTGGGINSSHRCLPGQVGNPVPGSIAPVSSGTLVAGVFCGAPASTAGMHGGDVIVAVNGQHVTSPASLTTLMTRYRPGTTVKVAWVDTAGTHHTSSIKLAAGPAK